jgi:hypothetical protein
MAVLNLRVSAKQDILTDLVVSELWKSTYHGNVVIVIIIILNS